MLEAVYRYSESKRERESERAREGKRWETKNAEYKFRKVGQVGHGFDEVPWIQMCWMMNEVKIEGVNTGAWECALAVCLYGNGVEGLSSFVNPSPLRELTNGNDEEKNSNRNMI